MDSHYPFFVVKRRTRAKCPTIIQSCVITFQFYRYRFHFRAQNCLSFPPGTPGNVIRSVFGAALYRRAPDTFRDLFDAGAARPSTASGLADPPRPFVLRASELDGRTFHPGDSFSFDTHVFALQEDFLPKFRLALRELQVGHGLAELDHIDQLDLDDRPQPGAPPCTVVLDGHEHRLHVKLRFITPTELKSGGELLREPDFDALFKRLRDRLSALSELYGAGPLEIDFHILGSHAEAVRLIHSNLRWESPERRSARTGQVHPIGGFTGKAEYAGDFLGEFMPWLRAARWVGVGRQTVWGKGDVRVVE